MRLEQVPGGRRKARKTLKMIDRLQNFAGYREYPKYLMMRHYWILKQAMLTEASNLVERGVIQRATTSTTSPSTEFREAVRTGQVNPDLIAQRSDEFEAWARLTPPRVITSDGEVLAGAYKGARVPTGRPGRHPCVRWNGRGSSADRSRPDGRSTSRRATSWSRRSPTRAGRRSSCPSRAVVTEVGGAMTHGAVVAREYGLPAVVGVDGAARLIRDGQRIRVNGTDGYVQIL